MTMDIVDTRMAASAAQNKLFGKATSLKKGSFVDPQKAWKAAQDCENMIAGQFMQQMIATTEKGMLTGGNMVDPFLSYFTKGVAEKASFNLGIADSIYPVLLRNQGADS